MSTTRRVPPPYAVPTTYIRGGTSKAIFFHDKDLPQPGHLRDDFLIRVMGSPDPSQIDGMGGAKIVTSKAAIICPSLREDADVDYTFVQVGLGERSISYDGNCGNISSGVGPFAINEGLLSTQNWLDGKRIVRIFNTGMKAILIAHVPVNAVTGRALEKGDYSISGCPGTGAPIDMDYSQTAKADVLLPTGNVTDKFECSFGAVDITFCSVGNPIVFAKAIDLGIKGNEKPAQLDTNAGLLNRIREVRGKLAEKVGSCQDWEKVDEQSPMLPMLALVSEPTSADASIQSRLFLDNHCHPSMAGTGGVCTTAAAHIVGSIPNQVAARLSSNPTTFIIQHPAGILPINVSVSYKEGMKGLPTFDKLSFVRTARYIMQGALFVPEDMQESWHENQTIPEQK